VKPRLHEDDEEEKEEEQEPQPQVPYRVAGDVQVRAAELEQELNDMKRQMRAMEREVYAARKTLRLRAAAHATSIGGIGALVGSIVGGIAYGVTDQPAWLVVATIIGFVFGFVSTAPWKSPDGGGDFPKAPPPRMF
jgi:hypothetical protein